MYKNTQNWYLSGDSLVVVLATDIKPLHKDHFFEINLSWDAFIWPHHVHFNDLFALKVIFWLPSTQWLPMA